MSTSVDREAVKWMDELPDPKLKVALLDLYNKAFDPKLDSQRKINIARCGRENKRAKVVRIKRPMEKWSVDERSACGVYVWEVEQWIQKCKLRHLLNTKSWFQGDTVYIGDHELDAYMVVGNAWEQVTYHSVHRKFRWPQWPLEYWGGIADKLLGGSVTMCFKGVPFRVDTKRSTLSFEIHNDMILEFTVSNVEAVTEVLTGEWTEPILVRFDRRKCVTGQHNVHFFPDQCACAKTEKTHIFECTLREDFPITSWQVTLVCLAYPNEFPLHTELHYQLDDLVVLSLSTWISLQAGSRYRLGWHIEQAKEQYTKRSRLLHDVVLPFVPRVLIEIVEAYC